ncbi:MAG: AI-2E family transporter [Erysipelotrichaceae bacterium]|nr:AI-2E family transporter [Erysipelotrichaceae bacterium]
MNQKEKIFRSQNWFYLITYAILLIFLLTKFDIMWGWFNRLLNLLSPLFYGIGIAFVLNLPMTFMEKLLIQHVGPRKRWYRPVAIITTLIVATTVVFLLSSVIFPQVIENIVMLVNNIPIYIKNIVQLSNQLLENFHVDYTISIQEIFHVPLDQIVPTITKWASDVAPDLLGNTWNATMSIAGVLANWFMGFMLSLYLLSSKEKFIRQLRMLIVAIFPKKVYEWIFYVGKKTNATFTSFISGQLVEAVILGCIFYVALLILKMPYALLISCCIAVTSIVPMFGAMIGQFFGFLLILAINPIKSLVFVVVFQLIQQFEGNVIYPKVVGNSVGLPGIWVLLSIVVFGGLMGLFGMLIAVPATAVLYTLLKETVYHKIKQKGIKVTNKEIIDL